MIDFLRNIPGPAFLIFYGLYVLATIVLVRILYRREGKTDSFVPDPLDLSPLELAFLNKGLKGSIQLTVFSLVQQGKISMKKKGRDIYYQKDKKAKGENELEKAILGVIDGETPLKTIYGREAMRSYREAIKPLDEKLQRYGFLYSSSDKASRRRIVIYGYLILLFPGILKLIMGINFDKPVGFLITMLIVGTIVFWILNKTSALRIAAKGKALLNQAQTRFAHLRSSPGFVSGRRTTNDPDPHYDSSRHATTDYSPGDSVLSNSLYAFGAFGAAWFIGTAFESMANDVDESTSQLASPDSSSGCSGSSCGGGSCSGSSCSGSSCGGSSCGGGCGGCGGGD